MIFARKCSVFARRAIALHTLSPYLQSADGGRLEPEISFEILGDLPHETLEGQLADEQLGGLLVSPDLTESHSAGPVSVRLLDSTGGRGGLPGSLGGQLLPGSLSSGGFTGGLLGTGHGDGSDDTDGGGCLPAVYILSATEDRGRHCSPAVPLPSTPTSAFPFLLPDANLSLSITVKQQLAGKYFREF